MKVIIESKAKPCPGVERAVSMTEDILRRGDIVYSVGQLIHNKREIERLEKMGLRIITIQDLLELSKKKQLYEGRFLVRAHGESEELLREVNDTGLKIVDSTCPIVGHSQELIDQHVKEGWGIIIAGSEGHAEVRGLLDRTKGNGCVISSIEDAENQDFEERSLLLAQTTIDPTFFSEIRRILSSKLSGLKIVDTTCRFLRNRQEDVKYFGTENDVIIMVGGKNSSNCQLLHRTLLEVNDRSYHVEKPEDLDRHWIMDDDMVGVSGGASTPRWQLEEIRSYLDNHKNEKNPKGLKNRKGGKFLWWKWKNQNKTE